MGALERVQYLNTATVVITPIIDKEKEVDKLLRSPHVYLLATWEKNTLGVKSPLSLVDKNNRAYRVGLFLIQKNPDLTDSGFARSLTRLSLELFSSEPSIWVQPNTHRLNSRCPRPPISEGKGLDVVKYLGMCLQ